MKSSRGTLPQDNLFRAVYALPSATTDAPERAVTTNTAGSGNTLDLQWSVFDTWTEINSAFEGHFMERIAPGAFAKTIQENQPNMRILLQHGRDPQIGNKPIASITEVGENKIGGYARGELFPGLDPLVMDGLRAGQYGSSFRFGVIRDDLVAKPERSAYNPKGIPERTIREASVTEFGPVTWGAYSQATSGVRSITDEIHFASLTSIPEARLLELVAFARGREAAADGEPEAERLDSEDFSCLSSMVLAGGRYIAQQDEDDPVSNTTTMNQVLELLGTLVQVEIAEAPEADDTSPEYFYSAPDSDDESRRTEAPETPVEVPAKATPTTDSRYLSKSRKGKRPYWHLSK